MKSVDSSRRCSCSKSVSWRMRTNVKVLHVHLDLELHSPGADNELSVQEDTALRGLSGKSMVRTTYT